MTDGPLLIFNITNEHGETAIIGDEIAGRDLTLNIQWESTSEFGKLDHIYIHRGIIGETEEEITEYHLTPNNLSGTQMYSNLSKKIPISKTAYIRLNASTDKNSKVYTNPIWINEEETNFTPLDLCMVLDRSGSMKELMGDIKKIEGVKKAANDVIDVLLSNDRISLISFSDTATTDIDFTSNFNEANTKIDQLNADGGTSFGAGLKKALDQFDVYGNPDHIPAILFMSDGEHPTPPDPDVFVAECKNKGIPIFTVGFASSELEVDDEILKRMSDETGGEYLFADKIFDLQNIFLQLQHKASGWESLATFTGEVNQGETVIAGTFYIDSNTKKSRVTLNWPGSDLDLVLYDPNGIQINLDSPNIIYSGDTKPEYVIINEPQSGTWTVNVYGKTTNISESYYVLVTKYITSISGTVLIRDS